MCKYLKIVILSISETVEKSESLQCLHVVLFVLSICCPSVPVPSLEIPSMPMPFSERLSFPSYYTGLEHLTCFSQWHVSRRI